MITKVGITGQTGFIGSHLYTYLKSFPEEFELIAFDKNYFSDERTLREFVKKCHVIVHLAGVCRSMKPQWVYNENIRLTQNLISALQQEKVTPYVIFSSSIHENADNEYGRSKYKCGEQLADWAYHSHASYSGIILPNIYGPGAQPYHTSFIATFCYQLLHQEEPHIIEDKYVQLLYIDTLCAYITNLIRTNTKQPGNSVQKLTVPSEFTEKVSNILSLLKKFKELYTDENKRPLFSSLHEKNLFTTFLSYL